MAISIVQTKTLIKESNTALEAGDNAPLTAIGSPVFYGQSAKANSWMT